MSKIKFGSQVYTWFMQGTGKGYDNKLDHMIKVAAEAGFTGIEPMVLEISESALGCGKYWLGDFCDPGKLKDALAAHHMTLAGLALVCAWDGEEEAHNERAAAVLSPRGLGMTIDDGTFLAVADGRDPAGIDAQGDEQVLDGVGAALAQGKVVLAGAALVATALDHNNDRVALHPTGPIADHGLCVGTHDRAVEIEQHVIAIHLLDIGDRHRVEFRGFHHDFFDHHLTRTGIDFGGFGRRFARGHEKHGGEKANNIKAHANIPLSLAGCHAQ